MSAKRLKLKTKNKKEPDVIYLSKTLLTDNISFVLFDPILIEEFSKINIPDKTIDVEVFADDLQFALNRDIEVSISKGLIWVTLVDYGQIKRQLYDLFVSVYPDCVFYPVALWYDRLVNTIVGITKELKGPPVAIVKAMELK